MVRILVQKLSKLNYKSLKLSVVLSNDKYHTTTISTNYLLLFITYSISTFVDKDCRHIEYSDYHISINFDE